MVFISKFYFSHFAIFLLLLALACKQAPRGWASPFPGEGTNSSLHAADLNGDAVLDFVMGGGKNLHEHSEQGILALDGRNGAVLWGVPAEDQMFGSPNFLDITGDGTLDVFIGGRKSTFLAIDGRSGAVLWQYQIPKDTSGPLKTAHFNFYNAQIVPDQNGDGLPDLLVANGGNVRIPPNVLKGREAGVLLVLNSKNGSVLAAATMPDGKETYMSPVVCDYKHSGELSVFFGTGGETIGGSFYRASWKELLAGDLSKARKLATGENHGFFAPPVVCDLNHDEVLDVVFNCHDSQVFAFDGSTDSLIWTFKIPGTETSSGLAPGFFNDDKVPDFFVSCLNGVWPDNFGALQFALDGKTGQVLRKYTIGCTGFCAPVTADFDGDGRDEAVLSVNEFDCTTKDFTKITSRLAVFDIHRDSIWQLGETVALKNLSTTPWLGDADGNGLWDVAFNVQLNTKHIVDFNGMIISLLPTKIRMQKPPTWGAYMGNDRTGILAK